MLSDCPANKPSFRAADNAAALYLQSGVQTAAKRRVHLSKSIMTRQQGEGDEQ